MRPQFMTPGHRVYSIVDRRYLVGRFDSKSEATEYAAYLGLLPGQYRIDSGTRSWADVQGFV